MNDCGGSFLLSTRTKINCTRRQQKIQNYITIGRGESALRTWRLANSARGEKQPRKIRKRSAIWAKRKYRRATKDHRIGKFLAKHCNRSSRLRCNAGILSSKTPARHVARTVTSTSDSRILIKFSPNTTCQYLFFFRNRTEGKILKDHLLRAPWRTNRISPYFDSEMSRREKNYTKK